MLCLFFNSTATTEIYTLSLHDALPICPNTHIHFDTFTIRDLELSLTCTVVNDGTLNVRSGPSKTFSQIAVISNGDRKSTRLNSSHGYISYAVFCLKKKKNINDL